MTPPHSITDDGRLNDRYFRTYSGLKYYHQNPSPDALTIEDFCHSLALQNRFLGHTREPYSVGQHSIYVSYLCPTQPKWGQMHDCSESVSGDCPSPFKYAPGMEAYRQYEHLAQVVIAEKFGLAWPEPAEVKAADMRLLVTEQRDLFTGAKPSYAVAPLPMVIKPWPWKRTKRLFMLRYKELTGERLSLLQRLYLNWHTRDIRRVASNV